MGSSGKIQLVIPMAGLGSRFSSAGYSIPKPFLPIGSKKMIEVVIENLDSSLIGSIVLIATRSANEQYSLREALVDYSDRLTVLMVDETTEGPASTVEMAYPVLNLKNPVVVANSDQYLDTSLEGFYLSLLDPELSGSLICMRDSDPKWSFVEPGEGATVKRVVEKEAISDVATTGVYGFATAQSMFAAISSMKHADDRTNNEFYVGPAYNYLPGKVTYWDLGPVSEVFHGLGTPQDYEAFKRMRNL